MINQLDQKIKLIFLIKLMTFLANKPCHPQSQNNRFFRTSTAIQGTQLMVFDYLLMSTSALFTPSMAPKTTQNAEIYLPPATFSAINDPKSTYSLFYDHLDHLDHLDPISHQKYALVILAKRFANSIIELIELPQFELK